MKALNRRRFVCRTLVTAGAIAAAGTLPEARGKTESEWGDFTGRLVYDGTPPPRKRLKVDKEVEQYGQFDIRDESLMVSPDGGLQNVYVYLYLSWRSRVEVCPVWFQKIQKRVILDNKGWIFVPHCMKIWYPRQEFYIVNSDPVAQGIKYSAPGDPLANQNFLLPVGGKATRRFSKRQRYPVGIECTLHPWESAYILPLDHPYAAITDRHGRFEIAGLPVGQHTFQFWHERTGSLRTSRWKYGRLTLTIRPGSNDLGPIKLAPSLFAEH